MPLKYLTGLALKESTTEWGDASLGGSSGQKNN